MQLHEQYRPTRWKDVVAQKSILRRIDRIRNRGLTGRAYWISGPSGTGKTTIARLIAAEVASDWCTEEADATDLTAARVRDLEQQSHTFGMGDKTGRAYIVNEAHSMNKRVVRQFLTTLERVPPHVVWIFTTTFAGQKLLFDEKDDATPLVSRCIRLSIDTKGFDVYFARRARKIAREQGINGKSLPEYVKLVRKHGSNLRAVLQEIESGAMDE